MPSIKELVKDNIVTFTHYYEGDLWYNVEYCDEFGDDVTYAFPVPVSDIGNAIFRASDKAMLFMRYIRKQLSNPVPNTKG